ncbi:MAG: PDZ domain-containing protein [Tissierellia bacterium]|nr:PDZ domain-containing protein [Tissierellia bacterium]
MDLLLETIYFSTVNILSTLLSPLFWIVACIVLFQYIKTGKMEKGILGQYKRSPFLNTISSIVFGLVGGILGSIVFIHYKVFISQSDFIFLLPLSLILSILHPRFICFSYAGGIVSLSSLILGWPNINVTGIMFVVGVLHLIESMLILLDGTSSRIPIFMEKDNHIIGGFAMNRFWPVPFVMFLQGKTNPMTLIAILGYGDLSLSSLPEKKARHTSILLFFFSIILIILSIKSQRDYTYKYLAAIFAPVAHEIIIALGRLNEERGKYIFKPSSKGLKILDTLPGSIGEKIGFKSGDILISINGRRIFSKEDVEEILYYRPRILWMDILDVKKGYISKEYKNSKGKGINSLGLIVISDTPDYQLIVEEKESSIARFINRFRQKRSTFRS